MTPERWRQIDSVLQAGLEHPQDQRTDVLDKACADDEALRKEVESLISFHRRVENAVENADGHHARGGSMSDRLLTLDATAGASMSS